MEELVKQLSEKVGIDKSMAEKVSGLIQQNAANLPALLTEKADGLGAMLTKLGISQPIVDRIIAFLKDHAADLPVWLGNEGGGILQKAKDALGGLLGGKGK